MYIGRNSAMPSVRLCSSTSWKPGSSAASACPSRTPHVNFAWLPSIDFFLEIAHDQRVHHFHQHSDARKAPGDYIENALHVRFAQVHRQTLDDDQRVA